MMGLRDEFNQGAQWISTFDPAALSGQRSFFDICTRVLGGLLSAHQLSQDPVPLRKAVMIAERYVGVTRSFPCSGCERQRRTRRLIPIMHSMPVPRSQVDLRSGASSNYGWANGVRARYSCNQHMSNQRVFVCVMSELRPVGGCLVRCGIPTVIPVDRLRDLRGHGATGFPQNPQCGAPQWVNWGVS